MDRAKAFALFLIVFFATPAIGAFAPGGGGTWVRPTAASPASPQTISLDLVPVADGTILSSLPNRNFGGDTALRIAADAATGATSRALLRFDLSSLSATAQIYDATLRVYVEEAVGNADIQAHRILAPWTEGSGGEYLAQRSITVTETAGIRRVREPVSAAIVPSAPLAVDPRADFRVFDAAGNEIPSQVTQVVYSGSEVAAATVVFTSSNAPGETRTYFVRYGYSLPSVPSYRQRLAWEPLWTHPVGASYASPAIADLDGDGLLETIVGSTDGNVYAIDASGGRRWSANLGAPIESPVAVADLSDDGMPEVLAQTGGASNHRVYALRWDGQAMWNSGTNPGKAGQGPMIVADVNGDGIKEVFVGATDRRIYAFDGATGATLWSYGLGPGQQAYGGVLANFSSSPGPELVFGTATGVLQALTTGGTPLWSVQPGSNSMLQTPGVADIDGDGLTEIVAGDRAANGNQFATWGDNGTRKWITATGTDQSGGNVLVDWGGDGLLEIVFAKSTAGQIGALRHDGKWLWNFTTGGAIYSTPAAADLDGDGEEDIIVGSFDLNVYVISRTGGEIRRFPVDTTVRGTPAVADIDGDGYLDIVFATETRTQAYRGAGLGHDSRVGSYNLRNTGRFLDGNSPDGAALLSVDVGIEQVPIGDGVTWLTRDGTSPWTVPGSEYDAAVLATGTAVVGTWRSFNITDTVRDWVRNAYPNVGLVLRLSDETASGRVVLGARESASFHPVLAILAADDRSPRILAQIPNQLYPEDSPPWTLNLVGFASDPDTPLSDLRWDLAGVDGTLYEYSGGNVTGNHALTFQPKPNRFGNNRVTIFLFDEAGRYASQALWVNLTPVNDPPAFTPPTTFYVHYDYAYTFDFTPYISDPDDPLADLYLTSSDAASTTVAGFRVTFLYPQSLVGKWQFVILTVSDDAASTQRTLAVLVTSDFPPELRRELPDVTLREGETRLNVFDLDDYFYDPDNDTLFYTFGFTHLEITIHPDTHAVDVRALGEWWGTESVTFRATDPTGALIEDTILVNVTPVNDPPVISGVPSLTVHWNFPYSFDLTPYIYDPDTPMEQISVKTSNPLNVNVTGRMMTMLYPDLGIGWYTVPLVINVSDGLNSSYASIVVTVGDDYPPVLLKTLPDVTFFEDEFLGDAFDLDEYFSDNDSATVFYSSGQINVVVMIKANHSVDFTAAPDWSGVETVRFRATDDRGALAEDTIKVIVRPVDDPPRILPIPDQVVDRRSWFLDLTPYIEDVDTDPSMLTVRATSGADDRFVNVAGRTLLFSYPDGVNADIVTITVSDRTSIAVQSVRVEIRGPDVLAILLPWVAAAAAAMASVLVWNRLRPTVEEVFFVHSNGLPIAHLSRTLTAEKDTDVVTSMFTAIQNLMNDIFRARGAGDLRSLELGEYRVSVARGISSFLVVLYRGRSSLGIERKARKVVDEVEEKFGTVLKNWNGDVDQLAGVKQFLEEFFKAKASKVLEQAPPQRLGLRSGLGGTNPAPERLEETPEPPPSEDPPLIPPP